MKLTFLGASKTVTGSCYHLESETENYLIDCGMFQGIEEFHRNYDDFKFDAKSIQYVFLTHGHIDHCGLLPKLFKAGFRGKVLCTAPTKEILNHILVDSARVQEKNLMYRGKQPLYSLEDALGLLGLIETIDFDNETIIGKTAITYRYSSHILGAASIELKTENKHLVFSGDIGRREPRIIKGFGDFYHSPDLVVMESLYGNRLHEDFDHSVDELSNILNSTLESDGNVIIPVFALHRSQEILHIVKRLLNEGRLNGDVQIFFDTPLGNNILNVYLDSPEYFSNDFNSQKDPFGLENPNLKFIKTGKQSKRLKSKKGSIIIAGGGMADGGKIIPHLESHLGEGNSSLVFVGFQAEGTLGNELLTKPSTVLINKKRYPVKLNIHQLHGLSAHGDKEDLLWWVNRFNKCNINNIFLTHAEPEQSASFKNLLTDFEDVRIPEIGDTFEI